MEAVLMTPLTRRMLIGAARSAAEKAYCVYSNHAVGAAVLGTQGKIYAACNIENASFGLATCAEHNAINQAVSDGERSIKYVAIYTPTEVPRTPCGACRQVMLEFAREAEVLCVCATEAELEMRASDMLVHPFRKADVVERNGDVSATLRAANQPLPYTQRVCVDIDNVVAQSDEVMRRIIYDVTQGRVSLGYEHITQFDYCCCRDGSNNCITKEEWRKVHDIFSEEDCINSLSPTPHAVECLNELSERFTIHFVTSRLPQARSATARWLMSRGFPRHDLHFISFGQKHLSLDRFSVSVEDNAEQAEAFAAKAMGMNFLLAHPWNKAAKTGPNLERVADWRSIVRVLSN